MSSKPKQAHGDYEYLRAAITQKEHTENEHGLVVTTAISLRSSPCVLGVRVEAWTMGEQVAQASICSWEGSWPNAQVVSWPAFLFQAYVKLDRLVEDCVTDWEREWSFRQK